jgi:RsiW-degrading membrane proteinase PrsW (M82 family)
MFRRLHFVRHTWFLVLSVGLALFLAMEAVLVVTDNINLLPTVILLGATLVPVTFVTYIYQRVRVKEIPVATIAVTVFLGGAIGLILAGLLEYATLRELGLLQLLGVSIIEESAKLVIPAGLYLLGRYRTEADGLLFGVASGMGFAAMESMGYGLVSFLQSQGSIGALQLTLLVRALFAPVGHAAWTGLLCAVVWRERQRAGRRTINPAVIGAFVLAVLLHTAWNTMATLTEHTSIGWVGIELGGLVAVGAVSLAILIRRMREAGLRHPSHFGVPVQNPGGSAF